ncbi:MAG: hypothetical protein RL173_1272 [Fibrobacterota bacterium]
MPNFTNDSARLSIVPTVVFCLAAAIGAASPEIAAHRSLADAPKRCDVSTAPLSQNTGCMDLSKLDGTSLTVPGSVTRLSTDGVVLCEGGGARAPGTDIVYIIDQSGSMTSFKESQFILPHGKDTINFKGCSSWKSGGKTYPGTVPLVDYLGYSVKLLDSTWFDSAMANCEPAGDPYQARAAVVQAAILKQSQLAPTSQAAWIGFGTTYQSSKMFQLGANPSRDSLVRGVIRQNLDKTYYAPPVGWARAMLQGAANGTKTMAPSPNKRKAIIMVSDGAPNDWSDVAPMLLGGAKVKAPDSATWTLPDLKSPPVYGFMLSTDASQGDRLKDLAAATGGQYYLIPPLDRDSLNRVMDRLLGFLIDPGVPDSLVIQNLSNGQVSNAVSSDKEGGGYRFRLDSLLGLQAGKNELLLRSTVHNAYGDTVLTAKWTLNVTDSVDSGAPDDAESRLATTCFEPTRIRLRPSSDSTRAFADDRDTAVRTFLDVRTDGQTAFRTTWTTSVSGDAGARLFKSPNAGVVRTSFEAVDPWILSLKSPVLADGIVQTRRGRDTLRALFRMARDPRDSAIASLPLFHAYPISLSLSPDTVSGLEGHVLVSVSDSNLLVDTAVVLVKHRAGDSLLVAVRKDGAGFLRGAFTFRQNSNVTFSDTLLQMGPVRSLALDSIGAQYREVRDTVVVRRISPTLRFVDGSGRPLDARARDTIDPARTDTVKFGLFAGDVLLAQDDSVVVSGSGWLGTDKPSGGLRLKGGLGQVVVTGLRPGNGGGVFLRLADGTDSLVAPIDVAGYWLRFVDERGVAQDSFAIDTLVRRRVRVRLQVWNVSGPVSMSGSVRVVVSGNGLVSSDSTGTVEDVFGLVGGAATVWLGSDAALHGAWAAFAIDSFGSAAKAAPLAWRAPAPDSAVYLDRDGDGALDRIRVHFQLPWNPANILHFPWPDAAHAVDLTGSVVACTGDSMVATWDLAVPQSRGLTAWRGVAQRGAFAWNSMEPAASFGIREAIAPIPLRARLIRGEMMDTLRVVVSESVIPEPGAQWLRLGKPSRSPSGVSIPRLSQDFHGADTFELVVDSSFAGGIGDSIRLAAPPDGGVADLGGNSPGTLAAWVPLEIGKPRLKLDARPWPALSSYFGWEVPAGESVLAWYTRPGPGVDWRSGTGEAPRQELSRYSGVSIRTNRELDAGVVYLYDNSGVSVATLDLAPLFQAVREGVVKTNARGDIEVWVAWNGTTSSGRMAATGVYLARVLAWRDTDGERTVVNQVFRLGWNVPDRFRPID